MSLSTLISPLVPVPSAPTPPSPAPSAAIVTPVLPQAAAAATDAGRTPVPQRHQQQRREAEPQPGAEPQNPVQTQVSALLGTASQMAEQANAAGGGAARAAQLSLSMAAAAARSGLEVRGALGVAERDRIQVGAGTVYHQGALIAAFDGMQVSFMRRPAHVDFRT